MAKPVAPANFKDILVQDMQPLAVVPRAELVKFYDARDYEPAWTGDDDKIAASQRAIRILQAADKQGLSPRDYLAPLKQWKKAPTTGAAAMHYDIALTTTLLRYAHDVSVGR
ncbi:MAG TPA: hypothetical protein VHL34_15050, partial [Rhizomicrobium sp.]|nr:hypothetical protein [Rhizomicrobium sp.]